MEKLKRSWWTLAVPAAMILMLLGELGLPTLFPALRAPWFRFSLIALVAVGLLGAAGWRRWRSRRASNQLAAGLAGPDPVQAEGGVLGARMRDALTQLRNQAGGRRNYLYDRPWYVIIGPPGAGKTTALANSGLRFPWADEAMKGVTTPNLNFWFADEAVLVDTAGRYVTQDVDGAADAAGWEAFLRLLRDTRPLEPINGVVVALGIDMLIEADRAKLDVHATTIRRRLAELTQRLQVSIPIYLLLPKADLIAGFREYFGDLSSEGRRAVLGATLGPGAPSDASAMIGEFDRIVDALWARSPKRLQEEPDQHRRGLILAFPAQMASLRARLAYLIDGAFRDGQSTLRGFYFASGTQTGLPFDRVLADVASVYDMPQPVPRPGQGRAYFLNRLLTEVMLPEAGMVRATDAVRRRRRIAAAAALAGIALVSLATMGLWTNAFARNKGLQNDLLAAAQTAQDQTRATGLDLIEVRESDPDLDQALPVLNRLRDLPHGFAAQEQHSVPWSMRLGLYQSGHATTARQVYLEALQRIMLPRLLLRAEQTIREQAQQPSALYAPLKAYLMLGGEGPLDRDAVRAWVVEDWRTSSLAGADRAEVRAQLTQHLDAMLADPDIGRVWQGRRAPLDGQLIAAARAQLQSLPLADRAYAVLRQRAAAMARPDWRADAVLASGDRQAFRNGDAVLGAVIPWFFTRAGYVKAYRPGLRNVQAELDRDLWVLGPDAAKRSIQGQLPAMRGAVAASYARDYIAAWDGMLATLQPANYFGSNAALGAITRKPSPLKVLLLETSRNTRLGGESSPAAGAQIDAGQVIEQHFRQVADFAGKDDGAAAPVDTLLAAVRQAAVANSATRAPGAALGGGAVQGQLATALGELSTTGVVAPPQLKAFVDQATSNGAGAATRSARITLEQEYQGSVRPACLQAAMKRYPFASVAAPDARAAELQAVFGINGRLDAFSRDRLGPLLDIGANQWRWRQGDPVAAGFARSSAAQLQKASAVRDLVAGGLTLNVGLDSLGAEVTAVQLSTGGTTYRFDATDRAAKPLLWNLAVLPSAQLVLFAKERELQRIDVRGTFALFRLMERAAMENSGPSRLRAQFGDGARTATLLIDLPSTENPFGRGGPFSFRCPARL